MDALRMSPRLRWLIVILFGLSMAWMEAATVTYLRALVGRIVPYQADPLPPNTALRNIEMIREFATLLMLWTVGWLAGRNFRTRFCYTLIAFGTWDIFYYVFLAVTGTWPRSVWDWDILFLLPLPWWGPVLAPVLISLMMVVGGSMVTQLDRADYTPWPSSWAIGLNLLGVLLALFVFMRGSVVGVTVAQLNSLPVRFNWPLFTVALVMMAVSIVELLWRQRKLTRQPVR